MTTNNTQAEQVPAAAFVLSSPVSFSTGDSKTADATQPVRFEQVARTGEPLDHWWWGRIVHDMEGFSTHKATIPLDYCHGEECGFCDGFAVNDSWELVVGGAVVPTSLENDIGRKVIERSRGGVPYEASIFFDPDTMLLEFVPEGYVTEVNGQEFEGPLTVVREWELRGVAVCPYGYDKNTSTELAELGMFSPKRKKEPAIAHPTAMSKTTPKPANKPQGDTKPVELSNNPEQPTEANPESSEATTELTKPEATPQPKAEPTELAKPEGEVTGEVSAFQKKRQEFLTAFTRQDGNTELANKWLAEDLSFAEAQVRFSQVLQAENTELKQRLGGLQAAEGEGVGESAPVGFSAQEDKGKAVRWGGFASKIKVK